MIHIRLNEEQYWRNPQYPYSKRVDAGMIYQTLIHMMSNFVASNIKLVIKETYGVDLSVQKIGHWLTKFEHDGYVTNEPLWVGTHAQSYYNVTASYLKECGRSKS